MLWSFWEHLVTSSGHSNPYSHKLSHNTKHKTHGLPMSIDEDAKSDGVIQTGHVDSDDHDKENVAPSPDRDTHNDDDGHNDNDNDDKMEGIEAGADKEIPSMPEYNHGKGYPIVDCHFCDKGKSNHYCTTIVPKDVALRVHEQNFICGRVACHLCKEKHPGYDSMCPDCYVKERKYTDEELDSMERTELKEVCTKKGLSHVPKARDKTLRKLIAESSK